MKSILDSDSKYRLSPSIKIKTMLKHLLFPENLGFFGSNIHFLRGNNFEKGISIINSLANSSFRERTKGKTGLSLCARDIKGFW